MLMKVIFLHYQWLHNKQHSSFLLILGLLTQVFFTTTADVSRLSQVMPLEGSEKITIDNGTSLPIHNIGAITIKIDTHSLVL